jgi:hypothetical protein
MISLSGATEGGVLSIHNGRRTTMKNKEDKTKILFTMPVDLKEELSKEAEKDFRSLNNYILWVLLNRNNK